jgi:hypothetical protein
MSQHPRACDCDFCRKHGAAYVNAKAVDTAVTFGSERAVSPKALSDTDKAQRWMTNVVGVSYAARIEFEMRSRTPPAGRPRSWLDNGPNPPSRA